MTKSDTVSPITAIEGELANLRTRQAELQARKAEAEGKRDAARSARKAALAADTAGDITKHTKAVRAMLRTRSRRSTVSWPMSPPRSAMPRADLPRPWTMISGKLLRQSSRRLLVSWVSMVGNSVPR